MRVIFLDVDGVLHPASAGIPESMGGTSGQHFRPEPMRCLAKVVKATGATIVLSSSWRVVPGGVAAVNEALQRFEMPAIHACTPVGESRVAEIWTWLRANRNNVSAYVAIDDSDLSVQAGKHGFTEPSVIHKHFVRTPSGTGLTHAHIARIVKKLQQPPEWVQNPRDTASCKALVERPAEAMLQVRNSRPRKARSLRLHAVDVHERGGMGLLNRGRSNALAKPVQFRVSTG
eukprot:TRINITY_DN11596_c0_g1_i1.p1 TRINITY_DN11596_c0_g1~~TRINITY_DN11596_c0_g1_i1.p1  ORF type:complete len:231 (-),score=32.36 TRINITY_DN11596_c0_g1_i1:318-1010(-)